MEINLSKNAEFIIQRLTGAGHECYAVGGCVRDCLRGVQPHDWDFASSAKPDEICAAFSDCVLAEYGKKYGTIGVMLDRTPYEVTTYRLDGKYSDYRHPDGVVFSGSLRDDLARRDFTVNAMAYNGADGLVDPFDGQRDLSFGVIRAVGVPYERFAEDALRILRALRFASTLGYTIEPATSEAILKGRGMLSDISSERVRDELLKLICGDKADFVLRRYRSVIAVVIPELKGTFDFEQNSKHHNRDVYRHIVASVKNIEPDPLLRTVMLLHDIAKPMARTVDKLGVSHYKNHPVLGAAMAEEILRRLCMPKLFIDDVCTLIRYHDVRFKPDTVELKRWLNLLGADKMKKLCRIQLADILAQSMYMRAEKLENLEAVRAQIERILESKECYSLKTLAVNGSDLLHMGVSSGRRIGEILNALLDKVITSELPNEKEPLISAAKEMLST